MLQVRINPEKTAGTLQMQIQHLQLLVNLVTFD